MISVHGMQKKKMVLVISNPSGHVAIQNLHLEKKHNPTLQKLHYFFLSFFQLKNILKQDTFTGEATR